MKYWILALASFWFGIWVSEWDHSNDHENAWLGWTLLLSTAGTLLYLIGLGLYQVLR